MAEPVPGMGQCWVKALVLTRDPGDIYPPGHTSGTVSGWPSLSLQRVTVPYLKN